MKIPEKKWCATFRLKFGTSSGWILYYFKRKETEMKSNERPRQGQLWIQILLPATVKIVTC